MRLLEIFASEIAPHRPRASLTLVGDGPDHDVFKARAAELGIAERCIWPGEVGLYDIPKWYRHADVFLYTSLSETYGQVVSEALWCGLPVVAFDDDKGVADQVSHDVDGYLIRPEHEASNLEFASRVFELLNDANQRRAFSLHGQANARLRSDPERCVAAYQNVFRAARAHRDQTFVAPASTWARNMPLVRMGFMHGLVAALGLIRSPAELNRNRQKQPTWHSETEALTFSSSAVRGLEAQGLDPRRGVASAA
jgi:hypothetical protein